MLRHTRSGDFLHKHGNDNTCSHTTVVPTDRPPITNPSPAGGGPSGAVCINTAAITPQTVRTVTLPAHGKHRGWPSRAASAAFTVITSSTS